MKNVPRIPESELEIMLAVWDETGNITTDTLMRKLNKSWKKTTLLNLLTRLCGRGFLACEKQGKINVYTALIRKEDYLQEESAGFLQKLHHNSLVSLVASLYDGKAISKEDLKELESYIKEAK